MNDQDLNRSKNRDDYYRCRICKGLYLETECTWDEIKGFKCPKQCVEPFNQPPYELPTNE